MDYIDSLSHFVMRLRESCGKTVESLAAETGIQPELIEAIESGDRKSIPRSVRERLAIALQVGEDELAIREYSRSTDHVDGPNFSR
ncbi:MAG: helix-turn-helix domain-containing protein [Phycisphaerales bacterium]